MDVHRTLPELHPSQSIQIMLSHAWPWCTGRPRTQLDKARPTCIYLREPAYVFTILPNQITYHLSSRVPYSLPHLNSIASTFVYPYRRNPAVQWHVPHLAVCVCRAIMKMQNDASIACSALSAVALGGLSLAGPSQAPALGRRLPRLYQLGG
jgi:hypothetical protein